MRILGISGVFDTVPTQVFSPTTSFNVNLGSRGVHQAEKPREPRVIWVSFRVIARLD